MKTTSLQPLGVCVGAGLTAQPGARGQAPAYDGAVTLANTLTLTLTLSPREREQDKNKLDDKNDYRNTL